MENITNERIGQYLLIFLFLFLIYLPMIDVIFKIFPDTELSENRRLVNMITITKSNISSFPKNFENYYNDNFGLRKYLIKANNNINIRLFSYSSNTRTILGKDNWLYWTGEHDSISIFRYKKRYTEEDLKLYLKILKNRKEIFAKQGTRYFMIIAPDKQSIYPEYLPEYILRLNQNSEYDQIADYLYKNSMYINIDVKKELLKEKQKGHLVYYKSDTHWNNYAAFIAYQQIMKKLNVYYPELKPMSLTDFDIIEEQYSGDISKIIGMQEYFEEKIDKLVPKKNRKANIKNVKSINGVVTRGSLLSECNSCGNITMVFIRDSQAIPLIPLVAEHFSRVIYIGKSENPKIIHAIIKNEKPDIVLHEAVERSMESIFYKDPNNI